MKKNLNHLSRIDAANEELWLRRFDDPAGAEKNGLINHAKAVKAEYPRGIAYSNLCIAAAYFLSSRNEGALKHLAESLLWFKENKHEKGYVRAVLLEGNIYESFGDYEKTLSLWLEALSISREIKAVSSEAEACSQLGLVYFRLSDPKKSLEYLNKGLKIREELNDGNGIASSLNRIGMVLRQTKEYNESLSFYFKSLEIRQKNRHSAAIPWTLLGIASTYEEMGNNGEAMKYYVEGGAGSDRRCSLQCLMGRGRILSRQGNHKVAGKLLKESLEMAEELKSSSLIADACSALAENYELSGDNIKALQSYKLLRKTRETLLSEESQSRLRNIEITHAIERSEQEKEIYRLRNVELREAYDIIEGKNRDITASINYARRIQNAMLPQKEDLRGFEKRVFVLYMPKDIVSGDFYWFSRIKGELVIAAGDCTGHGVPGALMSMLGISLLEEIVNKREILSPANILDELSAELRRFLRQKNESSETKDGMDITLCTINKRSGLIKYAGANNNLYVIRKGELSEHRADRMSAGYNETDSKFTEHEIVSEKGDLLYLFSDGYADQFGGPLNKKFKYSALKELLLKIHKLPPGIQRRKLEEEFNSWKGTKEQVDDVMIIGYRV